MEAVKLSELDGGGKRLGNKEHSIPTIITLVLATVMFITTLIFNGLSGSGAAPGLFRSTQRELSDKYDLPITPAGFTFSIWSLIYIWLAISLITLVVTIFLNNQWGRLYLNPPFATPLLNVVMFINFAFNLSWIFLWDREVIIGSCIVLILIALTNITVIAIMARNIYVSLDVFKKGTQMFKWGITYRLIVNGFGIYTTWTVIASLLNFTHAICYGGGVDLKTGSLTALSLLLVFHVTYFVLENTFFDKYIRYLLTPYMVVIWALNGIRAAIANRVREGETTDQTITDYVLALLIIASITLGVRIIIVIVRYVRDPARKGRVAIMQLHGITKD